MNRTPRRRRRVFSNGSRNRISHSANSRRNSPPPRISRCNCVESISKLLGQANTPPIPPSARELVGIAQRIKHRTFFASHFCDRDPRKCYFGARHALFETSSQASPRFCHTSDSNVAASFVASTVVWWRTSCGRSSRKSKKLRSDFGNAVHGNWKRSGSRIL